MHMTRDNKRVDAMRVCILNTPPQTPPRCSSSNNSRQAHCTRKVLRFRAREGLCQHICGLLISWAVDEFYGAGLDDVADKMVTDINMFGACMVLSAVCKGNR